MFHFSKGVQKETVNTKMSQILTYKDDDIIFGMKIILFTKYYPFKTKDGKKKTKWKGDISIRGRHNTIWILDNYCTTYYI